MTTLGTGRASLSCSRYLHLLDRSDEHIAFHSVTQESYVLEAEEYAYLSALQTGRDVEVPTGVDVSALMRAGFVVEGEEPGHRAVQRLVERRGLRRKKRNGHFGTLRLSLTERCNMACSYCFQQRMYPHQQPTMSEETLRATLAWFIGQGVGQHLTVQYFGGEPLLEWESIVLSHSLLQDAVDRGEITGYRETITTNGTTMSSRRARWLVDRDFDLTFSFDGPPDINDRRRLLKSGAGSYAAAANGLQRWREAGGQSAILMTATKENVVRLPEYVRWFVEESGLTPSTIGVNSPQPTTDGWETGGTELADAIWQIWHYCRRRGVSFHGPGTFIPSHLHSLLPQDDACVDAARPGEDPAWPIYVSADGRRSLCLVHHRDHRVEAAPDETHRLGHRWHSAPDPIAECDSCIASQICGGPCSLERLLWSGRLSEDRCGFMRRMTTLVLVEG